MNLGPSKTFHSHRNALFLVSDPSKLNPLMGSPEFAQFAPSIMSDPSQVFSDNKTRYGTIYVASNLNSAPLISVLKTTRHLFPSTGIYLMGPAPFSAAVIQGMGLRGVIPFPKLLTDLPMSPLVSSEVLREALATHSKKVQVRNPVRTPDETTKFAEVPIEDFFSGQVLLSDAYVRISASHYVKIAVAGSSLEKSQVIKYVSEGIGSLYIDRIAHLKSLSFYDYLSANIMNLPGATAEVKMCHLAGTTRILERVTGAAALTPERQDEALALIKDLYAFIAVEEKSMPKITDLFMNQSDLFTKSSAVAFACAILSRPLKYQSDRPKFLLGQAALFHDIGMATLPLELQNQDERLWSKTAKEKYQGHAKIGATLLSEAGFDSAVVQAVLYHHERRNSLSAASIRVSPLAEIVGIADELVAEIQKKGESIPLNERIEMLEHRLIDAFSPETLNAFKVCFGSERQKP